MSFPASKESDASNQVCLQELNKGESRNDESSIPDSPVTATFEKCCDLDDDSKTVSDKDIRFSEDELVELELLRDEEIDAFVEQGFLSKDERWNIDRRDGYHLVYPEMILDIVTGDRYPVRPLTYLVTNSSLPRVVVDQLRAALREIHAHYTAANSLNKWRQRASSESGCFEFEHVALHLSMKVDSHLKQFRLKPTCWRNQLVSRETDYHLSLERREYLYDYYDIDLLHDPESSKDGEFEEYENYDPLNPDWSRKIGDLTDEQKLFISEIQHQSEIKDSMFGIDPSSVQAHGLANAVLGKTPEEICDKIPDAFRILHIEAIIRSDLTSNFGRAQERIRKDLGRYPLNILQGSVKSETRLELGKRAKDKETLIDILVAPEMSFHCTREDLIPSIVRQGFLVPDGEGGVRCGSTYGRGIYSSPDPTFSLMYTQLRRDGVTKFDEFAGLKLIVCATIMGRCRYMARDDGWRDQNEPWPGSHSHCANDMMEYVVFDEAQIIPCYVIHLDLGRDIATYITALSGNTSQYINNYRAELRKQRHARKRLGPTHEAPGDIQRQKQALLAKAQKYFPYGYGASSGSKFAVLDVAEVSEDEEEYGQYQKDRVDGAENVDIWAAEGHGTLALDDEDQFEGGEESGSEGGESDDEKEVGELPIAWEYEMGPKGRTRFDEFYEARKAKNKKRIRPQI